MAGKIVADTLEHSTAGSIATNYVVNGSAKAWVNFNGTGTIAARDSFNNSSLTDNGTGDYTVNYTNSMGNGNYTASGFVSETGSTGLNDNVLQLARHTNYSDVLSSTFVRLNLCTVTPTGTDRQVITTQVIGDLA